MNWEKSFLDIGKEITEKDCSSLIPIVSKIIDAERAKEREILQNEIRENGFSGIKSGKKMAKKINQVYGRALQESARARVDGLYKTFEEHIRPKPKLIPAFVWKLIQRMVLIHFV